MTCNDKRESDDRKCLEACNACKVKNTDMFSKEMDDCMEAAMMGTEAEPDHSGRQPVCGNTTVSAKQNPARNLFFCVKKWRPPWPPFACREVPVS